MKRQVRLRQTGRSRVNDDNRSSSEALLVLALVLVVVGVAAAMLPAISRHANSDGEDRGRVIYMLIDVSASNDVQHRALISKIIYSVADRMPVGTRVRVVEYSNRMDVCYDGYPDSAVSLVQVVERFRGTCPEGRGTYPHLALENVLRDLNRVGGNSASAGIVVLTDGEDHLSSRTESVLRQLESCDNLKAVWLAPVKTQFRVYVEKTFGALGDRFNSSGVSGDIPDGCERFFTKMQSGS